MTKEEQSEKVLIGSIERNSNPYFGAIQYVTALEAMDIYAKEVAIEFAEWMIKNKYQPLDKLWWDSYMGSEYITSEQLYELFLQSKNQNQ